MRLPSMVSREIWGCEFTLNNFSIKQRQDIEEISHQVGGRIDSELRIKLVAKIAENNKFIIKEKDNVKC